MSAGGRFRAIGFASLLPACASLLLLTVFAVHFTLYNRLVAAIFTQQIFLSASLLRRLTLLFAAATVSSKYGSQVFAALMRLGR